MRTVSKIIGVFLLIAVFFLTAFAAGEAQIKIAVLEFENNSGKPELEHLKKGIRDMLTTDITQVNDITVVERARIEQVFKEINLSKSEYFDKDNSVKIGKMIGASYLLTGSYLLDKNTIRIDVRLVNISSGIIVYAEKVQGVKDDFFSLEKDLVSAIIEKMKPSVTKRELRKVNQMQTESYASFDTYSQAVYLEEQGNLAEAIKIMQKATAGDQSFKMVREKLSSFQKSLSARIAEQTEQNAKTEKSLKETMDADFSKCKSISEIRDHSSSYYMALLSLAVHSGLRSDFQNERDYLLRFWDEFSKEPEATKIWAMLQKDLERRSIKLEKVLMTIDHSQKDFMGFSNESKKIFTYPRFSNIWPFCQNFSIVPVFSHNDRRYEATHKFLPHDLFTTHYSLSDGNRQDLRNYADSRPSAREIIILGDNVQLKEIFAIGALKNRNINSFFYINHTDLKISKKNFA